MLVLGPVHSSSQNHSVFVGDPASARISSTVTWKWLTFGTITQGGSNLSKMGKNLAFPAKDNGFVLRLLPDPASVTSLQESNSQLGLTSTEDVVFP